jgi:hypothetical protein
MPTNRNNNFDKEFAIGTKIKYNGKLYEVIESNSCADCSIKSFCNASDEYIPTSVVPRDKLISIFGKCSPIDRDDNTSVVFMEIHKDDSKDNSKYEYYKISPLFVYNNPTQLRPIELVLPKGYVIDKEHSDLDKGIIRFKSKWLSLEQLYKSAKDNNYHTYLSEIKDSTGDKTCEVREKLIALANLMDIASYFNGGWEYDVTEEVVGYLISYDRFVKEPCYNIRKNNSTTDVYYGNPVFKNEADAQYVIDNPNFKNILDVIFKL